MRVTKTQYIIEQLFPSNSRGDLAWFESGDEYDTKKEALDHLKELKNDGRTGFRVVYKMITVTIIQSI